MTLLFLAAPLVLAAVGGITLVRRRRRKSRRLYRQSLERALADGILTEDETRELASVREEQDLSEAEVRMVALSLYRRALRDAVADSRITEQEDETLQRLRVQLGLSDRDLRDDVAQLQRVQLLAEVEREHLPHVESPLPLGQEEKCHWVVQARLGDRLAIPGRKSELQCISFDVGGATPFSAAGERSSLDDSPEILPSDVGMLVVTHCRLLFRGARRTVVIPHKKLHHLDLYKDGIALEHSEPAQRNFLIVDDPELTAAVLLCAARIRRNHLASLTTRTA
jgi:hypothetical protein